MDENSRFGLIFVILIVESIFFFFFGAQNLDEDGVKVLRNTNLTSFLPLPYGDLPNMVCKPVWNSYLLRLHGGMSEHRRPSSNKAVSYKGIHPSEIKPDEGHLPLTSVPPLVLVREATMYLAFQLKYNTTLKMQPIFLSFSSKHPHHLRLTVHADKTTIKFDFSSGNTDVNADSPSSIIKNRKTHGVLAILGWGLFLPFGAIFARYLKHKDSLWYYLNVVIQFIGFLFGIAAVIVGFSLNHRLHDSIPAHKGIGIFTLALTVLQVTSVFTRPSKDGKYRKYCCWLHNWFGRISLFFVAVNIVLGIHIAGSGQDWKIGYGFLVGSTSIICIVLEALSRIRKSEEPTFPSTYPMSSL